MHESNLTLLDLIITPIYLLVLTFIATRIRNKYYPKGHPLRRYYLPGLWVKFFGAIFIGCIYQFYYDGSGDTFAYYRYGKLVNSALSGSFQTWFDLILGTSAESNPYVHPYASEIIFYDDPPTYMTVRISAVLGLIAFNSYMPIAVLFAFISFTGLWALFRTFVAVYPSLHKQLAVAFLFVPSVFVWGSGIFKDTTCMFGLGWMTFSCFRIFVNKDFGLKNFLILVGSFLLVASVKIYILLAFMPSLAFWLLLTYVSKIRYAALRILSVFGVVGLILFSFFFFAEKFSEELRQYSLDNLSNTLEVTRSYIVQVSGEEGSAYDLGEVEPTPIGLLTKFPAAVIVTLFRPFLWEVNKPIMLLSAMEGLLFLVLFVLVFIRNGILGTFKRIFRNPDLAFFFIYSLIFAFAVGISTGNFGALSRYKIPCLPFFAALIVILIYSKGSKKVKTTDPTP